MTGPELRALAKRIRAACCDEYAGVDVQAHAARIVEVVVACKECKR